jgi:hypothetical protein
MGITSSLRKFVLPSPEEQEAKAKRAEEQRQKNYDHQMKMLSYQEASAKRQKALANKSASIRKLKGQTQTLKPRSPGIDFEAFFGPRGKSQPIQNPLKALAEHEKRMKKELKF